MPKEQPKTSTEKPKTKKEAKEERPKHEIELEKDPLPKKGEPVNDWLERIGGPNVELVKKIEDYSMPHRKKDRPFIIDEEGTFVFNDENIKKFYSEKNREKMDEFIEKKTPHISRERANYQLEKEFFDREPDLYFRTVGNALKAGHQIVADKRFGKGVEKWEEGLKEEKEKKEKAEAEKEKAEKEKAEKEKSLEQARAKFIEAEKEYNKYGKGKWWSREIGTFFKGKEEGVRIKEEYEKAKQEYEQTRAEHVADHLDKFMDERMELADSRAEKFEKSRWRKVWDWMGNQNLEKLGWKPKNKVGKFLARGINMRTGVSLGLLGTGIGFGIGSAVGAGALIARRVYGVTATGMGSYELLKMGTERYPRATDKKLESWDLDKTEEIMAKYEMRAKLKGQKVSENENYQKIKDRYLELLKVESEKADKKADALIKAADERLEEMETKLKRGDIYRKVAAAGIGVIGTTVGAWLFKRLINRVAGAAKEILTKLPPAKEISPEVFGGAEKLPDKFVEAVQQNEGYIHEARKVLTTHIYESGKPELGNLTGAQRVWAEDRLWDLYQQANPGAAEKVLHVGDTVEFGRDQVEQVINEVQERFSAPEKLAQLSENLKDYTDNVDWDRYELFQHPQMGEVYGWELDEGVRAVDWQQEAAGLKELEPAMPEPPKTGLVGMEEVAAERAEEEAVKPLEKAGAAEAMEEAMEPEETEPFAEPFAPAEERFGISDTAVVERVCDKYNLSPQAYNTIRNVPVGRFVNEFSYDNPPRAMLYKKTSFLEIWGKILLRNALRELLWGGGHSRYMDTSVDHYLRLVGSTGRGYY